MRRRATHPAMLTAALPTMTAKCIGAKPLAAADAGNAAITVPVATCEYTAASPTGPHRPIGSCTRYLREQNAFVIAATCR